MPKSTYKKKSHNKSKKRSNSVSKKHNNSKRRQYSNKKYKMRGGSGRSSYNFGLSNGIGRSFFPTKPVPNISNGTGWGWTYSTKESKTQKELPKAKAVSEETEAVLASSFETKQQQQNREENRYYEQKAQAQEQKQYEEQQQEKWKALHDKYNKIEAKTRAAQRKRELITSKPNTNKYDKNILTHLPPKQQPDPYSEVYN